MAWSNKATRAKFTVEKSHSLSFAVRVEDRLHRSIIQAADTAYFTVRPAKYLVGFNDTDLTVGTSTTKGTGIRVDAVKRGTGEKQVFQFDVQAAMLNLDPEIDWYYDITYVRDRYSISLAAGEFEIAENVTNRAASDVFTGSGDVFNMIATIDGKNLLTVTSSMPMPPTGDPGTGAYVVAKALPDVVGSTVAIPVSEIIAPAGRTVQVGDVLFSSITRGVLATVNAISTTGTPTATVMTRQIYGRETLKALLDTELHIVPTGGGVSIETIDYAWSCPKAQVPLPSGYEYRVGDMLFSHSAVAGYAVTKKMLVSIVESVTSTHLNVRTKVVFPMFLDSNDIEELISDMVPKSRQINGLALTSNLTLTEDHIANGVTNRKFTSADQTKLNTLPTNATLTTLLAGKAALSHTHSIADVSGLQTQLDNKPDSSSIDTLWTGTQAQYDAITTKNSRTLYLIQG